MSKWLFLVYRIEMTVIPTLARKIICTSPFLPHCPKRRYPFISVSIPGFVPLTHVHSAYTTCNIALLDIDFDLKFNLQESQAIPSLKYWRRMTILIQSYQISNCHFLHYSIANPRNWESIEMQTDLRLSDLGYKIPKLHQVKRKFTVTIVT